MVKRITAGRGDFVVPKFSRVKGVSWRQQYRHPNWLKYKAQILKRDRHQCRRCKTKKRCLHVHHRKYTKPYIWSSLPKDLVTLCDRCHRIVHRQR